MALLVIGRYYLRNEDKNFSKLQSGSSTYLWIRNVLHISKMP